MTLQNTMSDNTDTVDAWSKISELEESQLQWGSVPCNIIQISDHELLTMGAYCIHIFNVTCNSWTTHSLYNQQNEKVIGFFNPKIQWDVNNKMLFIQEDYVFREVALDGNNKFVVTHTHQFKAGEARDKIIFVNAKCRLIGLSDSSNNYVHQVWDDKCKLFKKMDTFKEWSNGLKDHQLFYNGRKQQLILFGGQDLGTFECNQHVMKYELSEKAWTRGQDLSNPLTTYGFSLAETKDGWLAILGGISGDRVNANASSTRMVINGRSYDIPTIEKIYEDVVLFADMQDMKFTPSPMKLPFAGPCQAVIMENKHANSLLISGWIREQSWDLIIPIALVDLVIKWHCWEFLYVFILHENKWELWRSITDIIFGA